MSRSSQRPLAGVSVVITRPAGTARPLSLSVLALGAVEVWSVPAGAVATILLNEPAGLCIGKVALADGSEVLGVLGEPALCEGQREITATGGWRAYIGTRPAAS